MSVLRACLSSGMVVERERMTAESPSNQPAHTLRPWSQETTVASMLGTGSLTPPRRTVTVSSRDTSRSL